MIKSMYIHVPFCKNICSYCDFCKMFYNYDLASKYITALEKEIFTAYGNEKIKTLYIGGGTPSILDSDLLDKLFSIINRINLDKNYEFTFECNIEDINEEFLLFLKNNNVNRLSIGIQSFNPKLLKTIGRVSVNDASDRVLLAKKYFSNINVDLIYGINGETLRDLKDDLNRFIELDINHISIYSLILEDNTILKVDGYKEIDDDLSRDMYDYIISYLRKQGYNHYEISNFEKDGTYSRHNMTYWDNDRYYGFGLGASGYIDNYRYTNTRSITKYLNEDYISCKDYISKKTDMENFMILGLRKLKGVSNTCFKKRYGLSIEDIFSTDKLLKKEDYYSIKEEDLYISNSILRDFIDV